MVEFLAPPICPICAGTLHTNLDLCASCERSLQPPPELPCPKGLASLHACVSYSNEVEGWIRRFKYPHGGLAGLDPAPAAVIAALARRAASGCPAPVAPTVIPVPLHRDRLRERGFNPAASIAREIARVVGSRSEWTRLHRIRATASQAGLGRRARAANVANAFEADAGLPEHVWLVDDVATTGHTLRACARALRNAGVRRVDGVCVARTPPP